MDSVKNTCIVTILEEGDFIEEGDGFDCRGYMYFCVGGYLFEEKGGILISRRGLAYPEVGGHTLLGEGCILISRRGSTSSGVGGSHILLLEDQGEVYFDLEEGSNSSEIGGDTLIVQGCISS